jgi:hypothetical protein
MHGVGVNTAGTISSIALIECLWILSSRALTKPGLSPLALQGGPFYEGDTAGSRHATLL